MLTQLDYQKAPIPSDEKERLNSLKRLQILDTPPEERFDRITEMALHLFKVPISTVPLIATRREWFKSCQGLPEREGRRAISFCGHALLSEDIFIIPDARKDPRFAKNPMVIGKPYIRFYAAIPLKSADGKRVGVFCIKDYKPRKLNKQKINLLKSLAAWAELELNTHEIRLAIESREKAEKKVAELNEVLRLSYKTLRHDLLNILTIIKADTEMYLRGRAKQDIFKEIFASIDQGVNSIKHLTGLESVLYTGTPLMRYPMKNLINNILQFFPSIKFKVEGDGVVWADQAIISVLENIIRNAKDHGKTDRIDISISNGNNIVKICITDYGVGIPNNIKDQLFQEGFKYGDSGHTGLGLYIIKKTIERYGGEVEITNSKPRGATFIIKLPGNGKAV